MPLIDNWLEMKRWSPWLIGGSPDWNQASGNFQIIDFPEILLLSFLKPDQQSPGVVPDLYEFVIHMWLD